jgi:N-carbamoylputrescine amidase
LSKYLAVTPEGPRPGVEPEPLVGGPTTTFAGRLAEETGVYVHASLWEERPGHSPGYNTAVAMAPDGTLAMRTRKLHIPTTAGYYEDRYFTPGPAGPDALGTLTIGGAQFGFPTCWGPMVPRTGQGLLTGRHRGTGLSDRHRLRARPPRIRHRTLWEKVIIANGITNATFMVAVNRIGSEGAITFYGSSFISDPYGRKLVQVPRDEPAVLIADLDLDQRRDWLELFPFLTTRRPDAYDSRR